MQWDEYHEDLENLRKPLQHASSLPGRFYTDNQVFQQEVTEIFSHNWLFVCRESDLSEPGQFVSYESVPGPAVVVRARDGELRAFANSCRHRGSKLLDGSGQCARIVCPYHSWVYNLDGQLIGAPGMDGVEGFDKTDYPLHSIALDTWGGFVFINFDDHCQPLASHLGNFTALFAQHDPANLVRVHSLEFDVQSNWKLLAENALEAYHTGTVHRETLGQQASRPLDCRGSWTGLLVEDEASVGSMPGDPNPFPHLQGLDEVARSGTFFTMVYPSTQFVFAQDCSWWLDLKPVAVDRTKVTLGACFPGTTTEMDGFADKVEPYIRRWDLATREDNRICEWQQQGQLFNRAPGRFALTEFATRDFQQWVADQLTGT